MSASSLALTIAFRPYLTDAHTGICAGAVGEAKVDDGDIRLELPCSCHRISHRSSIADDFDVGVVVE